MGRAEGVFEVVVGVAVLAAPALVAGDHTVEGGDVLGIPHFGAPVGAVVGFPGVVAAAAEPVGGEAHDLERAVSGEDHEVAPGERGAIFLLDRPDEAAGLVGVAVVPPAADRGEALQCLAGATTAVGDAVGAGGVPSHADHLRAVVVVVGRPPGDGRGQEGLDVLLEGGEVDLVEGLGVVEVVTEGIGLGAILVKQLDLQPVGIPFGELGRHAESAADAVTAEGALAFHLEGFGIRLVVDHVVHDGFL